MTVADDEMAEMLAAARTANIAAALQAPPTGAGVQPATGWCRAGCGEPLSAVLIDSSDDSGLHAGCLEPVPPPSTVDLMADALYRYDASRPRSTQVRLGPSELGTLCERQIAMKLAGVQQHERGLAWAPLCGTAIHTLMEDVLRTENEILGRERWSIESALQIEGPEVPDGVRGHGDAFDNDTATVVDWKYTGVTARRKAARVRCANHEKVSPEYRVQTHLYGLGHKHAGRDVRWVRVVMLARSHDYGESVEWTERYREDIALRALTRYYRIRDAVTNRDMAAHPERLAEVAAKPGDACKWCPFRRPTPAGGLTVDASGCAGDTEPNTDPAAYLRAGRP